MSINGVTNSQAVSYPTSTATNTNTKKASEQAAADTGVVYEPSNATESNDSGSTTVKNYSDIVKQMKDELSAKNQQLQTLVDQLLNKQATKYTSLSQLFMDVKSGKIEVDPETVAQAEKDVAEDGYWGVEQTSERIFSMAQALSGGDASKADLMIDAVKKGYEQAAKAWGGELPEICQKTIDAATKKLDDWKSSLNVE